MHIVKKSLHKNNYNFNKPKNTNLTSIKHTNSYRKNTNQKYNNNVYHIKKNKKNSNQSINKNNKISKHYYKQKINLSNN